MTTATKRVFDTIRGPYPVVCEEATEEEIRRAQDEDPNKEFKVTSTRNPRRSFKVRASEFKLLPRGFVPSPIGRTIFKWTPLTPTAQPTQHPTTPASGRSSRLTRRISGLTAANSNG